MNETNELLVDGIRELYGPKTRPGGIYFRPFQKPATHRATSSKVAYLCWLDEESPPLDERYEAEDWYIEGGSWRFRDLVVSQSAGRGSPERQAVSCVPAGMNWGRFVLAQSQGWQSLTGLRAPSAWRALLEDNPPRMGAVFSKFSEVLEQRVAMVMSEFERQQVTQAAGELNQLSPPVSEVLAELEEVFQESQQENWDGYESKPVTRVLLEEARRFCQFLARENLPEPEVSADPDGEVSFDWFHGDDLLSVSVGEGGRLSYAGRFGVNEVHGTEYMTDRIPEAIAFQISRLFISPTGSCER